MIVEYYGRADGINVLPSAAGCSSCMHSSRVGTWEKNKDHIAPGMNVDRAGDI